MVLAVCATLVTGIAHLMSDKPDAKNEIPAVMEVTTEVVQSAAIVPPQPVKKLYSVPLDAEVQDLIRNRCKELALDEKTVYAVIRTESNFKNIVSDDGEDYGIMQINRVNHKRLLRAVDGSDVMDVKTNVLMGTHLLHELKEYWKAEGMTGEELEVAMLSSYNKGIGGYSRGGVARAYVSKVQKFKEELK